MDNKSRGVNLSHKKPFRYSEPRCTHPGVERHLREVRHGPSLISVVYICYIAHEQPDERSPLTWNPLQQPLACKHTTRWISIVSSDNTTGLLLPSGLVYCMTPKVYTCKLFFHWNWSSITKLVSFSFFHLKSLQWLNNMRLHLEVGETFFILEHCVRYLGSIIVSIKDVRGASSSNFICFVFWMRIYRRLLGQIRNKETGKSRIGCYLEFGQLSRMSKCTRICEGIDLIE